jgi:hypothetical protein
MNGEAKGVTDSIQIGNEIKAVESEISATEQEIKSVKNTVDIAEKQAEKQKPRTWTRRNNMKRLNISLKLSKPIKAFSTKRRGGLQALVGEL